MAIFIHAPFRKPSILVPHILLIVRNTITIKKRTKLFLKRLPTVMLFLIAHILFRLVAMSRPDRKHAVTTLPIKARGSLTERLNEFRRFPFCPLDELYRRMHLPNIEENMNVIGNATHNDPRRFQISNDRGQISMHSRPNRIIQKRLPVLGAKDQMRVKLRKRLRHEFLLMRSTRIEMNMAFGQTFQLRMRS
jgi:hypothetical protein